LCAFLHNTSWRNHIKNMLKGNADLGLKLLDSWTASFIKWRFECVDDVLQQLKPLRPIMEGRVVAEMFGNVQDRVTLDAGIKACRDKDLWCYICAASDLVFRPCEKARHWGMVCDCPEHIRERREDNKKHIACWRNSMRLSGSHEFITKHLAKNKEVIKELVPALCENNPRVTETIRRHLQAKQSGLKLRGKYLGLVPWACSRMDTVAGATEVMKQMRARPLEDHDPLTQMIARTLGGDIDRRSQGEDASPALVKQVAFMNLAKLDESCGESYHRGTTVEQHRAPAAKSDHLKQENRFKQEQQRVRSFLRRHGARARKIVRFEWRCWKRVLQTSWSKRWTPKKLDARQAFKRIYHDDAMANENWSLVVDPERPQRPVITEDNSGDVGLQTEYLGAVFERHGVYEVPQRSTDIGANGELEVNDDTEFFQVLHKRSSHSRPHLMPTFINADEPVLTAALAIEVQPLRRPAEAAGSADQPRDLHTERLYPNTDPYWINGRNIASFEDMAQNMFVWRDVAQSEDAGVIVVSDKQRAKPQCHVLDENCPTLSVIYQIRDEGWRGRPVTTIVDTENVLQKRYDTRQARRWKPYYQALHAIDRCLPLTSCLPSHQPGKYYKLLLRGIPTEPYLGNEHYAIALHEAEAKMGKPPLALDDDPEAVEAPALLAPDDDDAIVGQEIVQDPQPKRVGKGKGRGKGVQQIDDGPLALPPPDEEPPPPQPPSPVVLPDPPTSDPPPPVIDPPVVYDDDDGIVAVPDMDLVEVPRRSRPKKEFRSAIGSTMLRYDEYEHPRTGVVYKNWIAKCGNPAHGGACGTSRKNYPPFRTVFGRIEPPAFLLAWGELPANPRKRHNLDKPSPEQVAAFVAAHTGELEEIVERIGGPTC